MPRDKSFKKGSQASKAPAPQPAQAGRSAQSKASAKPGQSKISDELRQAVKDLGGDDEDLELIAGVDEDEADSDAGPTKAPSKGLSEVSYVGAAVDMGDTLDVSSQLAEGPTERARLFYEGTGLQELESAFRSEGRDWGTRLGQRGGG
jgi:hypothetical protein